MAPALKRTAEDESVPRKIKNLKQDKKENKTPKYSKQINKEKDVSKFKSKQVPGQAKNDKIKTGKGKPLAKDLGKKKFPQKKFDGKKPGADAKPSEMEDWTEYKKKKKELKIARKQGKDKTLYELSVHAKQIGEKLRCKTLKGGEAERLKLCNELHEILRKESNVYSKLVLAHDMARIVQCMLKYATPKIREDISKQLIPSTAIMMQSKYSKFCVKRMLKYGSNECRKAIVNALYGNAVKLCCNVQSSAEIDYAYVTWATPDQKHDLQQEFYGDMYKQNKDKNVKCLADTYKDSPHMKLAMLSAAKINLLKIINKELLDNGLVHTVLLDFFSECTAEDRSEFITSLCSSIATISSTKEGSKVAMNCVWYATNKEKKAILKGIKEHILKMAVHEHGHNVLLALLSSIDDTVHLNKVLVSELAANAQVLVQNEWGRKVLLWLVAPKDTTHFHPTLIKELESGVQSGNSKKTSETRNQEILSHCIPVLSKTITKDSNTWLSSSAVAMVTLAIVKAGSGTDLENTLNSIAKEMCNPEFKILNDQPVKKDVKKPKEQKKNSDEVVDSVVLGVEHSGLHMVFKKILQHDKIRNAKNEPTFGAALIKHLNPEVLASWLVFNRACFLLILAIENGNEDIQKTLIELISDKKTKKTLQKQTHSAAKILIKKLM